MSSKINSAPASTHNEEVQKFANYMYTQIVQNLVPRTDGVGCKINLFALTEHEGAGGFKYTIAILKREYTRIFKPLIDSRSLVVYGYALTPQAIEALTCIVGDREQTLLYLLFIFMYSTKSKDIKIEIEIDTEQECIKLYKAFIIYHGDDKTTLQKLMNTPNKDKSRSTPLIGFMWEHGGKANEALVRNLFEAFGVPTWEHINQYGESPKSLWEQTHKRKPIELYYNRFAQTIYDLAVKYRLFKSNPISLFTLDDMLEREWDIVFGIWSCDTHQRWEFNLTQDVMSALGCIVGDTNFNLAYILLTCIPYSTENKYIEEKHIKLYKALLDRNCIREVLSQNQNELECRSTILIRMITQFIKINTDFVISLIKTIGADAWTHQNSDGGKSAEILWNVNHEPIKF
jgi:hypothetical protein